MNCVSNLSFTILDRQSSTARRKLSEALMIRGRSHMTSSLRGGGRGFPNDDD